MIRCLDIHTHHHAPRPLAVISSSVKDFEPFPGQLYSVGIHPWTTGNDILESDWNLLENLAKRPDVVAIGECGIDKLKGGPMFQQLLILKRQIDLAEQVKKPLILHDVRAHDIITGLKKDLHPVQNWLVHGLRGKPSIAGMLTDAGIYISFGQYFNPESVLTVPSDMLLAETDESQMTIEEIIANLSNVAGKNLLNDIAANTSRFLSIPFDSFYTENEN